MRIDGQAQAVLDEIEAAGRSTPQPRNAAERLAQARADTASLARFSAPPPAVRIEHHEAPGRTGHAIPLRSYRPEGGSRVLLWFHGGGAIAGSLDTHEAPLMALAERTGRIVVSTGYRLAPETRYPGQHEDCLDAARFVAGGGLDLPMGNWAIGGDSIGGLYAVATARALRGEGASALPAAQVLLYPNTDLRDIRAWPSLGENEGRIMTRRSLGYEVDQSIPRHADRLHPDASPLLADDLAGLPRCFLAICEADPLRDEAEAYGDRLDAAGVPLARHRYEGMIHAFLQMNGRIDRANDLMADIAAFLRADR